MRYRTRYLTNDTRLKPRRGHSQRQNLSWWWDDATAALHSYADSADCTVTTTQAGNESSSFELTSLTTGKALRHRHHRARP